MCKCGTGSMPAVTHMWELVLTFCVGPGDACSSAWKKKNIFNC